MLRHLVSLVIDIDICKESGIDLNPYDIESCRRLASGRVNTSNSKRVIVKFMSRKHSEAMLSLKINQ